jgi:RecB family exonuclease
MKSGVHFLSPGQCLVSWLRDQLTIAGTPPRLDFEDTWIVLPTTRLAGNLSSSLVAAMLQAGAGKSRAASIVAPRTMNLDGFLGAASASLPGSPLRALNPDLPEAFLHSLIKKKRRKHIDPGHAHELAHLISTAIDNLLPLENVGKAVTKILQDEIYHSDEHICALQERVDSIQATILDFLDLLRKNNLETTEMRRARLAAQIADRLDANPPWRRLVIAGFTSMVPAHMRMLRQLAGRPEVTVVLTTPFDESSPMARLARGCGFNGNVHHPAPAADGTNSITTSITTLIAANREEEINKAIDIADDLARKLAPANPDPDFSTSSKEVPPASVAILVPDENTYEPFLRKAFESRAKSGVNIAAPKPLAQTLTGSWFLHMAQFARLRMDECLEETRQAAAAFLTHPFQFGDPRPDTDTTQGAPPRDAARACIAAAIAASPDIRSVPGTIATSRDTDASILAAASTIVDRSMATGRALTRAQTQFSCLDLLERELARLENDSASPSPWEEDARATVQQILYDLRFIQQRVPGNAETMLELFVQRVKAAAIRDRGEPLTGLQVLTLAEARHVPFQAAVIVGCNEGVFPRSLPKDRLLDQFILRKLGLPTWEDLEAIEDTTFHLLQARLGHLVLTCSQKDTERPLVPSRYIELMKTMRGVKPLVHKKPGTNGAAAPVREQAQVSGRIMSTEAHARDITASLSASTLASLVACPFKYALDRQSAGPAPDYEATVKMRQGTWLHGAIHAAISGLTPSGEVKADARLIEARLNEAAIKTIPPELRETGILAHLESWSWPRLAAFTARNWTIGPASKPVLTHGESRFEVDFAGRQFTGSIDRFENLGPLWLVIDYKASKAPSRNEIAKGIRPQLAVYAHALAQSRGFSLDHCVAGHFEILTGNWVPGFVGAAVKDEAIALGLQGPRARKVPQPAEAIHAAAALMRWREDYVTGSGPAYLPDQSSCGLCPHSNICRRADVAAASWFANPVKSRSLLEQTRDGDKPRRKS